MSEAIIGAFTALATWLLIEALALSFQLGDSLKVDMWWIGRNILLSLISVLIVVIYI